MTLAPILLSENGSDRATAYLTSRKIVRHGGKLYVAWLDAAPEQGRLLPTRLAICEEKSGAVEKVLTLGMGYTNHCGPALSVDPDGRFHLILGAHHGPFLHRWSDTPALEESWSEPIALGPYDTYPSLAIDAEGTLHLAHRRMEHHWELWYRRKPKGQPWEAPKIIAISPLPGYNHFYQSLSIGPDGTLHLLFEFFYSYTGASHDAKGRMAVHLTSEDRGKNWWNEGRRCTFPMTVESVRSICSYPQGGLKISSHVVDRHGRLWFCASLPDEREPVLFRRDTEGWTRPPLPAGLASLNFLGGRETMMSRDASGQLHLVTATGSTDEAWYHPSFEVFHATFPEDGASPGSTRQLSTPSPAGGNWLPSLEAWDWTRREQEELAVAWTQGESCGEGGNINTIRTNVFLLPAL